MVDIQRITRLRKQNTRASDTLSHIVLHTEKNEFARGDDLDPQHEDDVPGSSDVRIPVNDQLFHATGWVEWIQVSGESDARAGGAGGGGGGSEADKGGSKSLCQTKRERGNARPKGGG